ncbi:MAG: peptidase T [Gemmataceae bacterium]|nr:peptidase T [Gemmataceae bacterium]
MSTLLERFLRYVQIDTQADESSKTYPSTPGQLVLGKMLAEELRGLGLADAKQDEHGIVTATLPATVKTSVPTIAWIAHVDTSPETSGKDVKPQVIRDYDGRDLVLPGDPTRVIRPTESPELLKCLGKTVITTDGTTLLGADDKAGIAVIMSAVQALLTKPDLPRGPIKIVFTCDEEIGRGVIHVDPATLGAVVGYTLDGFGADEIEGETFSADKAIVTIHGVNIHPSIGKGKMINAVRLAGLFLDRLPRQAMSPETTSDRQGFIHPYEVEGGVASVTIGLLLRDFDTAALEIQAGLLRDIGKAIEMEFPGARVEVAVRKQYRNMAEGIAREPRAMSYAIEAMKRAGMEPRILSIRGGTDGAQLTEKGLPTPNLSTGEHNPHSPLEWTCLEEMEEATRVLVELAQVWATKAH